MDEPRQNDVHLTVAQTHIAAAIGHLELIDADGGLGIHRQMVIDDIKRTLRYLDFMKRFPVCLEKIHVEARTPCGPGVTR